MPVPSARCLAPRASPEVPNCPTLPAKWGSAKEHADWWFGDSLTGNLPVLLTLSIRRVAETPPGRERRLPEARREPRV